MTTGASRAPGIRVVVRALARLATWIFYRVERIGSPLPDGAVLLVANHPNSLFDPALIWVTAGRDVRFLAKSTLFHLPVIRWLVRGAGAIPVYRRMDAGVDTSKNVEMFTAVESALVQGDVVCIFPEGISHSTGRLEPLRTGAARIVLGTLARAVGVAIVPVGLNFDRKAIFRSRATVVYGRPFSWDDLVGERQEDMPPAVHSLTNRIGGHLRQLIVEADPRSDVEIVNRIDRLYAAARGVSRAPGKRLERLKAIATGIEQLRRHDPQQYETIREKLRTYDSRLARFGLRDRDLDLAIGRSAAIRFAIREAALALLLVPLAVLGVLVFAMPYGATAWIASWRRSLEEQATWKAIGGAILYAAWMAMLAGAAGLFFGRTAAIGTIFLLPVLAVGALLALERETAVFRTVRAYLATRQAPDVATRRLRKQRAEIADVLERAREWMEGRVAGA